MSKESRLEAVKRWLHERIAIDQQWQVDSEIHAMEFHYFYQGRLSVYRFVLNILTHYPLAADRLASVIDASANRAAIAEGQAFRNNDGAAYNFHHGEGYAACEMCNMLSHFMAERFMAEREEDFLSFMAGKFETLAEDRTELLLKIGPNTGTTKEE